MPFLHAALPRPPNACDFHVIIGSALSAFSTYPGQGLVLQKCESGQHPRLSGRYSPDCAIQTAQSKGEMEIQPMGHSR